LSYISGPKIQITAGKILAKGRVCRVPSTSSFTVSSTGYSRLIVTVDLSKSVEQQVSLDVQNASAISGFAALTQNDINQGGTKYQFVLCYSYNSGRRILWRCGAAHSRGFGTQVTLAAGSSKWPSNKQNVNVDGVLADSNVIVTYAPASQAAWEAANIRAVQQFDRSITFECDTVPSVAVTANILLY
jgi:hypothetical protein